MQVAFTGVGDPLSYQVDGLIVLLLASAVQNWAISANPFFSSTIRIQSERGHRVMTTVPFRPSPRLLGDGNQYASDRAVASLARRADAGAVLFGG